MNNNYDYVMKDFSEYDYISFIRNGANEDGLICVGSAELYFEEFEGVEQFTVVGIHEDAFGGEVYGEIGKLIVKVPPVGNIILQWGNLMRKYDNAIIANKAISNILTSFASFAK